MKKFTIVFTISVLLIAALIVLAFVYISIASHQTFNYELYTSEHVYGVASIDRYVTEDKVIYKGMEDRSGGLGYSSKRQELYLKRKTLMPIKYYDEETGARKAIRSISVNQSEGWTDMLYLKPPAFFDLKGFETGENTTLFSPYNVMMYMPMMELYNYWRKGTQFFEVMIPIDSPIPVLRDKIEIRYVDDAYVPVMGKRIETERFIVTGGGVPEAIVDMTKYTHTLVSVEIRDKDIRFILTELPGEVEKLINRFAGESVPIESKENDEIDIETVEVLYESKNNMKYEDVFFESDGSLLSGRLLIPEGEGPFSAVVLVFDDGPVMHGEEYLLGSIAEDLCASGVAVFDFDDPGQGKSQGAFRELDDGRRVENIRAAVTFTSKHPLVKNEDIVLVGFRGGGYLAVKTAQEEPLVSGCAMLGLPAAIEGDGQKRDAGKKYIYDCIKTADLGQFDATYIETIDNAVSAQMEKVKIEGDDISFFMRKELPVKAYREYLLRKPYEEILAFERPLLLVFGKDDINFYPGAAATLKSMFAKKENVKIAVFRSLDLYMGGLEWHEQQWEFRVNEEISRLLGGWLRKNNQEIVSGE